MVTKSRSFVLPATSTSTAEPTSAEVGASSVAADIAVVATRVLSRSLGRARQLPHHVVQDAAMLEVFALLGRVDTHAGLEADRRPRRWCRDDRHLFRSAAIEPDDLVAFASGEAERLRR